MKYEMVDVNGRADSTMVKRKTDKQWWKNTIKKNKHLATWKIGEELKRHGRKAVPAPQVEAVLLLMLKSDQS